MRENRLTYETMASLDRVASGAQTVHKMTPQQRQAPFLKPVMVQTAANGSNTIPAGQHAELGQDHSARMEYHSKQVVPLLKLSKLESCLSPHNSIKNLAVCLEGAEQHTQSFQVYTSQPPVFMQISLLRCHSQYCCRGIVELEWK